MNTPKIQDLKAHTNDVSKEYERVYSAITNPLQGANKGLDEEWIDIFNELDKQQPKKDIQDWQNFSSALGENFDDLSGQDIADLYLKWNMLNFNNKINN